MTSVVRGWYSGFGLLGLDERLDLGEQLNASVEGPALGAIFRSTIDVSAR